MLTMWFSFLGHSSAGTPEFVKRNIINFHNRERDAKHDEWTLRNRINRKQQHDTFSLNETRQGPGSYYGVYSDGMSVQSLDTRRGGFMERDRFGEDLSMRPAIMPRYLSTS